MVPGSIREITLNFSYIVVFLLYRGATRCNVLRSDFVKSITTRATVHSLLI